MDAHGGRGAGRAGGGDPAVAAHRRARRRCRRSAQPTTMRALRTRWASPTRTWCAAFAGASIIPRTSSLIRARRPMSSGCSSGARASASPRSRSAVAPRSSAGSARTSAPAYNGAVSIDLGAWIACWRSTRCPARRASRRARSARTWRRSSAEHELTLRHFPQSFEYSTLGGWIATRAAGHFATVWTHIEDLVESVRAITPVGVWESRRLPGSGAGVSPDRMLAGSEGTLGVITQAWVRVQPRPAHRRSAGVRFASFLAGVECVRAISSLGCIPANCRLLDAARGRVDDGRRRLSRPAGARLRVDRPSGGRGDGASAADLRRARRSGVGEPRRVRRGRGQLLAGGVPGRSISARRARRDGRAGRDVRDGDHLGALLHASTSA